MLRRFRTLLIVVFGLCVAGTYPFGLAAQTLSQQVLQLLSRTNSWIGSNTFYDLRVPIAAVPVDTTARIYTDIFGNLYYNSILIAGSGGVTNPHNLLSTTHPDTLPGAVARGAVVIGNSTPKWALYQPSVTGCHLQWNGTDTLCSTSGASLTSLPAANLTGTLAAISGVNLTALNASNLGSGTVPLARLSGITNTQVDAAAAIAYSKLNLASSVNLSTDTAATALPFAKGGTGLITAADDTVLLSTGSAWAASAVPNCPSDALSYTTSTNSFSCTTLGAGTGTVTSAALSLPAILSVSGSPITSSGTFTVSLATQTANTIFAGPTTGAAVTPTFRALVAADIPNISAAKLTSGVANLPSATGTAPAYAFSTEATLGLYRYGAGIIGVTGALYPYTDAASDVGLTTQRWRNGYFSGNTLVGTIRLGWNATADLNTLLTVTPGTYPAMLIVSTGSGGARGDINANKVALGSAGDPTFAATTYSRFNLIDTWTAALTAQALAGLNVQQTVNQTGAATQTAYAGRFVIGTTSASNQSGLTALLANATYGGSAVAADVRAFTAQTTTTAGTITAQYGIYVDSNSSATVTNNYAAYIGGVASSPTLTNQYGLYLADQTVAGTTLDYAVYYAAPASKPFFVLADGTLGVVHGTIAQGNGVGTFTNTAGTTGIRYQYAGIPTITGSSFGTTNTVTAGSTDTEGEINVGTTANTTGVLNFQTTWSSAPRCIAQLSTTTQANVRTVTTVETTTTATFGFFVGGTATAPADSAKVHYFCIGTKA